MKTIDDVYGDIGGLGRFQFLMIACVYNMKAVTGWSMLLLSYVFFVPDYRCLTESSWLQEDNVSSYSYRNDSLNVCIVNGTLCKDYDFIASERTVITEWNLVCDLKWVKTITTSVQMTGVLCGALLAGQLGDAYGRKKPTYAFTLYHSILNVVVTFSVSWQMFAVCRFLVGVGIGGMLITITPYPVEFLPLKWRGVQIVIPSWALGVAGYSLTAWLTEDWTIVHLVCAAISALGLLGYFVIPESVRWLTVHGRLDEAHEVLEKVARINRKHLPTYTTEVLEVIAKGEKEARTSGKGYSYFDIFFRSKTLAWATFVFAFSWATFAIVTYGLSFGVSSLAGNVYVNICLMAVIEIPSNTASFYFVNKIGRRATCAGGMFLGAAAGLSALLVILTVSDSSQGVIITVLSLIAKMGIGIAWLNSQTWIIETYPTVTRYLGYGAAGTSARIGAIISPFVVNLEEYMAVSYAVIGLLSLVTALLMLTMSETKDVHLPESMKRKTTRVLKVSAGDTEMEKL